MAIVVNPPAGSRFAWKRHPIFGILILMTEGNPKARAFAVEVARIAHDHKGEDITAMDLRGISPVTDFTVICTGTSERQMRAVADHIMEYGRKVGERPFGTSGYDGSAWVLLDFVDVVVHIFAKSYRDYYDLDLLWGDAPRIDWRRSESA